MKNLITALLLILVSPSCFAQIKFEAGYFISNGTRTNCLIKNVDWKNNPIQFEYKTGPNSPIEKGTIDSISEFGIDNFSKYTRYTVDIDQSPEEVGKLSENKNPEFINQQVFLKSITEGKARLYVYETADFIRYFFSLDSLAPKQLIHKSYRPDQTHISENEEYKKQLAALLTCKEISIAEIEKLDYKTDELQSLINKYNHCIHSENINYNKKIKNDLFNLTVRPGVNISSLSTSSGLFSDGNYDFGSKASFRIGVETEFILPFFRNKWALIAEPVFQSYNNSQQEGNKTNEVHYKSIQFSAGARHYFFLNDLSKIFLNASVVLDLPLESHVKIAYGNLNFTDSFSGAVGAGFKFKDHFSGEMRYLYNQGLLNNYIDWSGKYQTFAVVFGYTIF